MKTGLIATLVVAACLLGAQVFGDVPQSSATSQGDSYGYLCDKELPELLEHINIRSRLEGQPFGSPFIVKDQVCVLWKLR